MMAASLKYMAKHIPFVTGMNSLSELTSQYFHCFCRVDFKCLALYHCILWTRTVSRYSDRILTVSRIADRLFNGYPFMQISSYSHVVDFSHLSIWHPIMLHLTTAHNLVLKTHTEILTIIIDISSFIDCKKENLIPKVSYLETKLSSKFNIQQSIESNLQMY
jgi:hypothetical protein